MQKYLKKIFIYQSIIIFILFHFLLFLKLYLQLVFGFFCFAVLFLSVVYVLSVVNAWKNWKYFMMKPSAKASVADICFLRLMFVLLSALLLLSFLLLLLLLFSFLLLLFLLLISLKYENKSHTFLHTQA